MGRYFTELATAFVRGRLDQSQATIDTGLQAAREEARAHLRGARDFAWNATNLSRDVRRQLIDVFADYGARVRIVYVEASPARLFPQNRNREAAVPEGALHRIMERWEVPDATEADQVECWVNGERRSR